jgi:hypothetical protein
VLTRYDIGLRLTILAGGLMLLIPTQGLAATSLEVSLPQNTVPQRERTRAEIWVKQIPSDGLAAFQVRIAFDPTIVSLHNPNSVNVEGFAPLGGVAECEVERGEAPCPDPAWHLTSSGRTPYGTYSIDNDAGVIQIAYATEGSDVLPEGDGVLLLVDVEGKAVGSTALQLENVILANAEEPPSAIDTDLLSGQISVSLNCPDQLPGGEADANLDGTITGADYTIWADNYHKENAQWCEGDFNGDGTVTGADYTVWADSYVTSTGP